MRIYHLRDTGGPGTREDRGCSPHEVRIDAPVRSDDFQVGFDGSSFQGHVQAARFFLAVEDGMNGSTGVDMERLHLYGFRFPDAWVKFHEVKKEINRMGQNIDKLIQRGNARPAVPGTPDRIERKIAFDMNYPSDFRHIGFCISCWFLEKQLVPGTYSQSKFICQRYNILCIPDI